MNVTPIVTVARLFVLFCVISAAPVWAQSVRLNEILASNNAITTPDGKNSDYAELFNSGATAVNLSDYSLTDDPATPRKWVFPAGTQIAAGGYLAVVFDSGAPATVAAGPLLNAGFGLSDRGDRLNLYAAPGAGGFLVDSVVFGVQTPNYSIGRVDNVWVLNVPSLRTANTAATLASPAQLRINEWMADPASGDDWFEIFNMAAQPVALAGLTLTDDPASDPRLWQIPALSFIGAGGDAYLQFWADNDPSAGPDTAQFRLGAGGESIAIVNPNGQVINSVTFGSQLEGVSEGRLPDGVGAIMRFPGAGSPGESNYQLFPGIVVNEVLSHTDPPFTDAVEFYNRTASPIDIGGWYLSDKRTEPMKYRIPAGTIIPANGYITFYEQQINGPVNNTTVFEPFTFSSASGDQVYLFQTANQQLTGYRVEESFEPAPPGLSFGRFGTSTGDYRFVLLNQPTFGVDNPASVTEFATGAGASNAYPRVGPVVISEFMYRPPMIGTNDNSVDEFIELQNITAQNVPFFFPGQETNRWRLQGGVDFLFPANFTLPPHGFVLVVSFNPATDTAQLAAFRSKYNVPEGVPIVGPYTGRLHNDSDEIELYRPDAIQLPPREDAGLVPYYRVDKVNYDDRGTGWPTDADASGRSVTRVNVALFGNDPLYWASATPTPGRPNNNLTPDTDGDGMSDLFESIYQFNPIRNFDAALDADNDGVTNLRESIAGTNPRFNEGSVALRVDQILAPSGTEPIRIVFTATAGQTYTVQVRNSLTTGTWQNLANVPAQAQAGPVTVADTQTGSSQTRFYRLVSPAQ